MHIQELVIRTAFKKGYRVTNEGFFVNANGDKLAGSKSKRGYISTSIRYGDNKKVTRCYWHRLQAYQKYGDLIFDKNIVVRHLNNISTDNSIPNIAIGSQSDNMMDIPKEKRTLNASNPIHPHLDIIIDRNNGMTYSLLMKKYSISSKGTLSFIINKSLKINQIQS